MSRLGGSVVTSRWMRLLLMARLLAAAVAAALLVLHRVTPYDGVLIVAVFAWTSRHLARSSDQPLVRRTWRSAIAW